MLISEAIPLFLCTWISYIYVFFSQIASELLFTFLCYLYMIYNIQYVFRNKI